MFNVRLLCGAFAVCVLTVCPASTTFAQSRGTDDQFGPVVRAYLGYLRNEQEVVDDRVSRHQVSVAYYRRNSNRIRALRQMAIQIAYDSQNDYLPELEAVAPDEFGLLFSRPLRMGTLRTGEVVQNTFRYLGNVRTGESFYLFARLDPYEQSELIERANLNTAKSDFAVPMSGPKVLTRTRRVSSPQ
jgi:hypothetical protein